MELSDKGTALFSGACGKFPLFCSYKYTSEIFFFRCHVNKKKKKKSLVDLSVKCYIALSKYKIIGLYIGNNECVNEYKSRKALM